MILLIDGYNLIKQIVKAVNISSETRSRFINELAKYAKKKNHKVIIIFDGGDFPFPAGEVVNDVQIIYSGYKNSADSVIKDYLAENSSGNTLLVSSDRELRDVASKLSIDSIKSLEFYNFVKEASIADIPKKNTSDTIVYKTSSESDQNLDELMFEASNKIDLKDEDFKSQNLVYKNQPSKDEQKKLKKFKKL